MISLAFCLKALYDLQCRKVELSSKQHGSIAESRKQTSEFGASEEFVVLGTREEGAAQKQKLKNRHGGSFKSLVIH